MQGAYNPDAPPVDQSIGAHPMHTGSGSRFNSLDSRVGATAIGASVQDAIAEFKKGSFSFDDLKQLAFAMGYQVVEGRNTTDLVVKIQNLEVKVTELTNRASGAEGAFAGKNELSFESLREVAISKGFQFIPTEEWSATTQKVTDLQAKNAELTARAEQAESSFTSAQSELDELKAAKG